MTQAVYFLYFDIFTCELKNRNITEHINKSGNILKILPWVSFIK